MTIATNLIGKSVRLAPSEVLWHVVAVTYNGTCFVLLIANPRETREVMASECTVV